MIEIPAIERLMLLLGHPIALDFRILFGMLLAVICFFPVVRFVLVKKLGNTQQRLIHLAFGVFLICYSVFLVSEYFLLRYEIWAVGVFKSKTLKAWDLESNYLAVTHPEGPYARDGVLQERPALSTPPVFAFLYFMTRAFGDDFSTIERIHRLFWWICNLLIAGILVHYCIRRWQSIASRDPGVVAILVSVFMVGFLPASYQDYLGGNYAYIVALLITIQIALDDWDSGTSKFLQGFLISVAFYIKPNILLIVLLILVFSIKRKKYRYIIGIMSGVSIVFILSLLAPNIDMNTYRQFLLETSRAIQTDMQSNWENLSLERIEIYQSYGRYISRSILFLMAGLIVLLAGRDDRLVRQEIPCLIVSVIPWPIFWGGYLAWVFIGLWGWSLMKLREREKIYIETILIFLLSWFGVINPNPLMTNAVLLALLMLFFKRQIIGRLMPTPNNK